jgi:hypothetical protein
MTGSMTERLERLLKEGVLTPEEFDALIESGRPADGKATQPMGRPSKFTQPQIDTCAATSVSLCVKPGAKVGSYCATLPFLEAQKFFRLSLSLSTPFKATPEFASCFERLFMGEYLALRGEAIVAGRNNFILTNYRLFLLIDDVTHHIPLWRLTHCQFRDDGWHISCESNEGETELNSHGEKSAAAFVEYIKFNAGFDTLSMEEKSLAEVTRAQLEAEGLRLPDVGFINSRTPSIPQGQPTQTPSAESAFSKWAGIIFLCALVATCGEICGSEKSSTSRVLQNGQIPGYRDCIKRLARTCPRCPLKICCDEVGGDNYKPGTFPTCEKYGH